MLSSWVRMPRRFSARASRSPGPKLALPAATRVSRAVCIRSTALPRASSVRVMAFLAESAPRWLAMLTRSCASARSARAAAVGSSLGRITRLPLVRRVWASESSRWRRCSSVTPASYWVAVAMRVMVQCSSASGGLQQRVEHALRHLQGLGRGLVALLELDQAGGLLVEVHAGLGRQGLLGVLQHRGRDLGGGLG